MLQLALGDDLRHQGDGFRGHGEAQVGVAGGETGRAQHPQRVLHKGRGHVPQHPLGEVPLATVGVDDCTVRIPCHGIDRQVPPPQVFLQGDRRIAVHRKAGVAVALLALGAGEGVLVFGLRVQEYGEVLAHLRVALLQHLCRRGTDHHPVSFRDRILEQGIADRAADQVGFHRLHCTASA